MSNPVGRLFALLAAVTSKGRRLITVADLARQQGRNRVSVHRWASGKRDLPTTALVDLLAILRAAGVRSSVIEEALISGETRQRAREYVKRLKQEKAKSKKEKR